MDALAILHYGNETVRKSLDGLPRDAWETQGVCGWWSVKDILAHLYSFELLLVDALRQQMDPDSATPTLDGYLEHGGQVFNDTQVPRYTAMPLSDLRAAYQDAFRQARSLAERLPADLLRRPGTIPWYGDEYALDDLIVYQYYGHKREHCAQIMVFRDTLK